MLVVVCVIVGFVIWLLTTQIPLPPGWAQVIQVLAVIVLVLYILSRFVNLPNVLPR